MVQLKWACSSAVLLIAMTACSRGSEKASSADAQAASAPLSSSTAAAQASSSATTALSAAPAAAPAASSAGGTVVTVAVSAKDLAKDGSSLTFSEFVAKYGGGKRVLATGKVKLDGGDLVLEGAPKNVFLAFSGSDEAALKAKVGKTATVECDYGGTANKAVNLKNCTAK